MDNEKKVKNSPAWCYGKDVEGAAAEIITRALHHAGAIPVQDEEVPDVVSGEEV